MSAKVRTSVNTRRTTFLREERGSASPLLAFALVTLIGASGLAFDSGRSYLIRSQLSQAVIAAAAQVQGAAASQGCRVHGLAQL